MSKSKGNVVDPDEIVNSYGADTARLFILFAAPPERDLEWSEAGVEGAHRFLQRVWRLAAEWAPLVKGAGPVNPTEFGKEERDVYRTIHETLQKVTGDIEDRFSLNTSISAMMTLVNRLYQYKEEAEAVRPELAREGLEKLVLMLAPFAPHLAEELWHEALGHQESVHLAAWPEVDPDALQREEVEVVVQVNGKLRDRIWCPPRPMRPPCGSRPSPSPRSSPSWKARRWSGWSSCPGAWSTWWSSSGKKPLGGGGSLPRAKARGGPPPREGPAGEGRPPGERSSVTGRPTRRGEGVVR